ncbi:MAG: hypothetical protein KGH66_01585, partial [Candidatus Micrarchaeota archaeon]|nr:hypothetical protein [Candidatus Micrarchaeota archaeon]
MVQRQAHIEIQKRKEMIYTLLELNGFVSNHMINRLLGPDIHPHNFKSILRSEGIRDFKVRSNYGAMKRSYPSRRIFGRDVVDIY